MEEKKQIHEQDRVLAVKNKSVIVSASAGSGKTHTMINKIYKTLVEENVDVSSLLVLTYTDAAATEMKLRLNGLLTEKLTEGKNVQFLQNQLSKISVADISTFHSFYEKLIKSNYYYLNINPAFSILENAEIEILKEKAFKNAMQKIKSNEEKFLKLFVSYSKKRNERGLKKRIYNLFNFLSAQHNEEDWLDKTALKLVENPDLAKQIINDFYSENIDRAILEFEAILKKSVEVGQAKIADHSNRALSKLNALSKCSISERQRIFLNEFTFDRFMQSKDIDLELFAEFKRVKEDFGRFVKNVKEENLDVENIETDKTKLNYELFLEFYKSFIDELNKLKVEMSAYDFSDLEKMALKLLQNERVRQKVKEQYRYIFVDEFQDVNNLQNAILNLIAKCDNAFIVGDPKQSIYAFRQSDVELFSNKQKEFDFSERAENLSLKNNYRSNKKILEFCNGIFSKIITEKTTGLNYKETSMFQPEADIPTAFQPVNFLLCQKPEREEREEVEKRYSVFEAGKVKAGYSLEVLAIYNQIKSLVGKEIYDKSLKTFRKVRYGDIAILVRKRGSITNGLAQIFDASGIPYLLNAEKDLKKSKLVVAFIPALRFASGYYSEIDLATILNKFFAVSYQELANIRQKYFDKTLSEAVEECAGFDDKISAKLKKFKSVMEEFKFQISVVGIYLGMNFLIQNSNFEEFRKGVKGFDEETQRLNAFFKFVKDSKFDNNLILLLNLIDQNETLNTPQTSYSGLDRVNITTIHSSKGLEYPIVILAGLNSDLGSNKVEEADIKIHKNLGIALKSNEEEKTIFEKAIKIVEKKEALAENLRLLYVGMTRAENHLFITAEADFSKITKVDENSIYFVPARYINYILGALDNSAFMAVKQGLNYICEEYSVKVLSESDLNEGLEVVEAVELSNQEKQEVLNNIFALKEKEYLNGEARFVSQKTSVSELLDEGASFESVSAEPNNFELTEHLSGVKSSVDMGTAIHEIMERADLQISFEDLGMICKDVFEKYVELGIELPENFAIEAQKVCYGAIEKVNKLISKNSTICREKKFMLYASPKEIIGQGTNERVLIQGIVDFFAIGEKVVLIDYKYSNIKSEEKLKNKYKNQLKIYGYALEKFLNKKVDESYLLNLKSGQIIKL